MKIPSSLKIGGHTISIKMGSLDGKLGESDYDKGLITIDKNSPQSIQESTLIHEVIHFLNTTLGDSEMGHSLIDSLSEQLYQVLKDNNLLK